MLGFHAFGAIEMWVPIIVFVFAFGLSMDYEVFLLSRIKECYDEGCDTNKAVAYGLQRSGRIITSAAFLVMIVFLGFAAGQSLGIKEFGLAMAIAVAIDATLVRCILVPATMTLLGPANWWAPAPLRRLHQRLGLHEAPAHPASLPAHPSRRRPPPRRYPAHSRMARVNPPGMRGGEGPPRMWPCEHPAATRAAHEHLVAARLGGVGNDVGKQGHPGALTLAQRPAGGCDEGCVFPAHPLFARLGPSLIAGSPVPFGRARLLRAEPIEDLG